MGVNFVPIVRNFYIKTETFEPKDGSVLDGCVQPGTHRLMRFDFLTYNKGDTEAHIGKPENRPDLFEWSQAHGHYHLKHFNEFKLLNASGAEVVPGFKQAFCLKDVERTGPHAGPGKYMSCSDQGLSPGWADLYSADLPCQFIVIDGVPDGEYTMVSTTNAKQVIPEDTFDDNSIRTRLRISGSTVTVLTQEDIMSVPLVVALWQNANFGGNRRVIVEDTSSLTEQGFNDSTSAIGIHPGPDYNAWKASHSGAEPTVGFFQDVNYGGACLILTKGAYPNIHALFNFGDTISSVKFNTTVPSEGIAAIESIPLVVTLYEHADYKGRRAVIIEDVRQLSSYLGSEWNDMVSSVQVRRGPNYSPEKKARLFRSIDYSDGEIQLEPGDYPNIGVSDRFNDALSSIKVR